MAAFVLYNYFRSSASFRVRIALNLKGLAFEYRAVHLLNNGGEQKKADYVHLNPSAQVPTLIHDGRAIGQSMAIVEYLDLIHPEPQLFPEAPYERALVLQFCEMINSGVQPLHNLSLLQDLEKFFAANEEKKTDWTKLVIGRSIPILESFLKPHAGDFCFGAKVSAADCFLVPHLANVDRWGLNLAEAPTLARIRASCEGLTAFRNAAPPAQPDFPKPPGG